jgi:translocation and assembly module TamB
MLAGDASSDQDSALSRFEVVTGRDVTQSGAETISVSVRLHARDIERKRGYYLVGERDVYDYYNYGVRFVFRFR